jgi:hypothetical protein
MTDFETVKGFLQELQLAIVAEDPAEGIMVVEDEERGIKHLIVDCEDPMLILPCHVSCTSMSIPCREGCRSGMVLAPFTPQTSHVGSLHHHETSTRAGTVHR